MSGIGSRGFPYRTNGGKRPAPGLLASGLLARCEQKETAQLTSQGGHQASPNMINSVKYTFVAIAVAALASIATAQITPRPASWIGAGGDGFNHFLTPLSSAQAAGFTAEGVNINSDGTIALPAGFVVGTPSITFNPLGGNVTVLFLGESAGWENDLGYVVNPASAALSSPAVYNPLVVNLHGDLTGIPTTSNLVNNTSATIAYGAGAKLDFFLNGVGDPWNAGGTWFAFGTPNQFAGTDTTIHTKYKNTVIDGVATLIVAFEDSRHSNVDADFSDVLIAFQGVTDNPVPEPSTYGLIGAGALLGLVAFRRFKRKAA